MKLWKINLKMRAHSCGDVQGAVVKAETAGEAYELFVEELREPWMSPDRLPPGMYERQAYDIIHLGMELPGVLLVDRPDC